jgi:RNA polymerase sigma-70 factor (ECF subfamily)
VARVSIHVVGAVLTAILEAPLRVLDADTELMLRFQAGENACFDDLVGRFRQPLLGFVYRMVRDAAASEEIIQEAFLRVYLHRARYQPQAKFSTWLYRIANHLALNHIRDHRRERMTESLDQAVQSGGGETVTREFADPAPSAEQAMVARAVSGQRATRVRQAIEALPERQRAAVIMHKYQGLDYEEIGGAMKMSASATKSLLFRAYESLRGSLQDLL